MSTRRPVNVANRSILTWLVAAVDRVGSNRLTLQWIVVVVAAAAVASVRIDRQRIFPNSTTRDFAGRCHSMWSICPDCRDDDYYSHRDLADETSLRVGYLKGS